MKTVGGKRKEKMLQIMYMHGLVVPFSFRHGTVEKVNICLKPEVVPRFLIRIFSCILYHCRLTELHKYQQLQLKDFTLSLIHI